MNRIELMHCEDGVTVNLMVNGKSVSTKSEWLDGIYSNMAEQYHEEDRSVLRGRLSRLAGMGDRPDLFKTYACLTDNSPAMHKLGEDDTLGNMQELSREQESPAESLTSAQCKAIYQGLQINMPALLGQMRA